MAEPSFAPRHVRLFRDNLDQTVRIPAEFELPGTEAMISREGNRLIIEPASRMIDEPAPRMGLVALLDSWGPLDEEFPDPDDPPPEPEPPI